MQRDASSLAVICEDDTSLQAVGQRQKTPEFLDTCIIRAGTESTISQAVRGFGLRQSCHFGHAKTHLQHLAIRVVMNLMHLVHPINDDAPAPMRHSHVTNLIQVKPSTDFASSVESAERCIWRPQQGPGSASYTRERCTAPIRKPPRA
ncbi:transposase [Rhodovastum atsumiense]|uniref:transposase n=1 Tax=Rhodovastum atsumiense TaxID=504468 RepID=UPI0038D153C9